MFIASSSEASGAVPGLQSLETAIAIPSDRIREIGGNCFSRR